jgi:hypothetical protein
MVGNIQRVNEFLISEKDIHPVLCISEILAIYHTKGNFDFAEFEGIVVEMKNGKAYVFECETPEESKELYLKIKNQIAKVIIFNENVETVKI